MHVVGNPETSYKPYSLRQKLRSISLSLDALLDYNDKDIEESTFEVETSLFAMSMRRPPASLLPELDTSSCKLDLVNEIVNRSSPHAST
ncbi:uncharacterized protein LOC131243431 isoform X3 [Magnolia sinica]|uniref:uncharacterized protein LOC131243431 isoform X3 n=1 Tax=Magnolia sinica TaxID=86752 RepID=UPI00265825ED|nr:uncharacterized protein LOC131243431 isoform X3 [Magnolia sinica]